MKDLDTIVAISTPQGKGGIHIIRVSGNNAIAITQNLIKMDLSKFEDRKLYLVNIKTSEFVDRGLVAVFKNKKSYTGEESVEIQCHGGFEIAKGILSELINYGARLAENGEFTKRAFLNGKISLSGAEGMIDMINSSSSAEIKAGYRLLKGELAKETIKIQEDLQDVLAKINVALDFPEEDIDYTTKKEVEKTLNEIKEKINLLLKSENAGKMISDGIDVAIIGKPNVGKSSILNRLLGYDRAIVTEKAGTTRDTVIGSLSVKGIKINLIDTAGIRESDEEIERIGVEKSRDAIKEADVILRVVDASGEADIEDEKIKELLNDKVVINILNKIDLGKKIKETGLELSAKNDDNVKERILELIYEKVVKNNIPENSIILTNERHINALKEAKKSIEDALNNIDKELECIEVDIKNAWEKMGEISGTTANEEIINTIFSKFCLGK